MSFSKKTIVRIEMKFSAGSIYDNTDPENPVLTMDAWEACEDTRAKLKTFVSNETEGSNFTYSFSPNRNNNAAIFGVEITVPDETSSDRLMTKLQNNLNNFVDITLQKARLIFISDWQRDEE